MDLSLTQLSFQKKKKLKKKLYISPMEIKSNKPTSESYRFEILDFSEYDKPNISTIKYNNKHNRRSKDFINNNLNK